MAHFKDEYAKGNFVTYRPEIRILDCTIRDGGLINNHHFDDAFVKAIYQACVAAGIDYMEFGYRGSHKQYSTDEHGAWRFTSEDDIRRIVGDNQTPLKIAIMTDAERTDYQTEVLPKKDSVVDLIRVATYIHQIPVALDMIRDAHEKGYETTVNLMAISTVQEREIQVGLEALVHSPVDTIYLVDSFGAYYFEQIRDLTLTFLKAMEGTGKELGLHMHNNQQLAYANTLEGLVLGANRLDATFNGMGRGAGNCPIELLLGFLKNPKFKLRPVLQCIQEYFVPLLRDGKMEWGYMIPYMITGMLNQHPRSAIKLRSSAHPDDYTGFFDEAAQTD
jgi:4-hydroxy 2-oxovalerate aldolase